MDVHVTLFDKSPFVESRSSEQIRAYSDWGSRDSTVYHQIGRTGYTGTGEIGTGFDPPEKTGPATDVPLDAGFPSGTTTRVVRSAGIHQRLEITFEESTSSERVGVFYADTGLIGSNFPISIVKLSNEATIKPTRYTETSAIGTSVTLRVTTTVTNQDSLRWMLNNGPIIDEWNGRTNVTIDNVKFADAGVYECYEDGRREHGEHSIMILIVRACPNSKYGKNCSQDCPTCWNGGICEDETGVCVCPPGFTGISCEIPCGDSNHFGASCSIICKTGGDTDCKEKVMCPPDPIGCTCVTGFTGLSCDQGCLPGKYGAYCDGDCHCSNDNCDPAIGCDTEICDSGYGGISCQARDICPNGFFGELCNFACHCEDGISCNKTGICINNECASGWAGLDCQQALPVLAIPPKLESVHGLSFTISWDNWNRNRDYGVGPGEKYQVHCWLDDKKVDSIGGPTEDTEAIITTKTSETEYECEVSVLKTIENDLVDGPPGPKISVTTQCGPPSKSPIFQNNPEMGVDYARLHWDVPEGEDWLECSDGLQGFILLYGVDETSGMWEQINITDPKSREYKVISLSSCTAYIFSISANNKYSTGPDDKLKADTNSVAPESPKMISVEANSSSILIASWVEPLHECGLTDYVMNYKLLNYDQCNSTLQLPIENIRTTQTSITITNLEAYSTYAIQVAATLDELNSTISNDYGITGSDVPTAAPNNVREDSSAPVPGELTFRWEPPPCGQRKGAISQYEYQFAEKINHSVSEGILTNKLMVTLDGLYHYTFYEFGVAAMTPNGQGPYSDALRTRTAESAPDNPPTNIRYNSSVKNEIIFTWSPPPEGTQNGIIISYQYRFGKDLQSGNIETGEVEYPMIVFPELSQNTCYEFQVQANTIAGGGPFTNVTSACTLSTDPVPENPDCSTAIAIAAGLSFALNAILIILLVAVILRKLPRTKKELTETQHKESEPTELDIHTYADLIKKDGDEHQYMGIYNDVAKNDITENSMDRPAKKTPNVDYENMDSNI